MLWNDWWNLVCDLRSACARNRTFLWMAFCLASVVRQKSCNVIPEDFAGQMNRDRLGYDYPVAAWLA